MNNFNDISMLFMSEFRTHFSLTNTQFGGFDCEEKTVHGCSRHQPNQTDF
jgi:hypothetical protein